MRIKTIGILVAVAGLCFANLAVASEPEEQPATTAASAGSVAIPPQASSVSVLPSKRPPLLPVLYVTLGALQTWDILSTSSALKSGAHEANPVTAPFATNKGSLVVMKVATTAGTIFFAERMWKTSRVGSIVMMGAIDGITAAVAVHNVHNAKVAAGRQ